MEYYIALGMVLCLNKFTTQQKKVHRLSVTVRFTRSFWHSFLLLFPLTFLIVFRWNVGYDSFYGNSYTQAYHAAAKGINFREFELGFFYLMRLFATAKIPFFWFLFFQAFVFMLCVTYGINKGSVAPFVSILVFFFLQVYFDAFSALRQALAEGLAIIALGKIGNEPKTRKRNIICLSLFAVAAMFHTVAALYLVVFFLCSVYVDKKLYIFISIIGILFYPVIQVVLRIIMQTIVGEKYTFMGFASSYTALAGVILLVCIINYDVIIRMNPNSYFYLNMALIAFLLMMNSNALMLPYRVFDAVKVGYIFIVPYVFKSCRTLIDKLTYPTLIIFFIGLWFFNSFYLQDNVMAHYQSVIPVWDYATHLP